MFDAIWKFLNNVLPELQTVTTETKRSKLLAQHDAFLASRHKMYGVGDKNIRSLLNLLNEGIHIYEYQRDNITLTWKIQWRKQLVVMIWIYFKDYNELLILIFILLFLKVLHYIVECPSPLLVTGSSGIGKSTLLSVFISRVKSEYRSQFSVAYHCVGHAEESSGQWSDLCEICL